MNSKMVIMADEPRTDSYSIEVPLTVVGQRIVPFPSANMRNFDAVEGLDIYYHEIQVIWADDLNFSPSGLLLANFPQIAGIMAVLYNDGFERAKIPLPLLVEGSQTTFATGLALQQSTTRLQSWKNIDWSKSYLQIVNPAIFAAYPLSVMFDLQYDKIKVGGK